MPDTSVRLGRVCQSVFLPFSLFALFCFIRENEVVRVHARDFGEVRKSLLIHFLALFFFSHYSALLEITRWSGFMPNTSMRLRSFLSTFLPLFLVWIGLLYWEEVGGQNVLAKLNWTRPSLTGASSSLRAFEICSRGGYPQRQWEASEKVTTKIITVFRITFSNSDSTATTWSWKDCADVSLFTVLGLFFVWSGLLYWGERSQGSCQLLLQWG